MKDINIILLIFCLLKYISCNNITNNSTNNEEVSNLFSFEEEYHLKHLKGSSSDISIYMDDIGEKKKVCKLYASGDVYIYHASSYTSGYCGFSKGKPNELSDLEYVIEISPKYKYGVCLKDKSMKYFGCIVYDTNGNYYGRSVKVNYERTTLKTVELIIEIVISIIGCCCLCACFSGVVGSGGSGGSSSSSDNGGIFGIFFISAKVSTEVIG